MGYEQWLFDTFYPYQNILQFGYRSTSLAIETASFNLYNTKYITKKET